MRGRKPVPTHLKVLTGNPGKRSLSQNEPRPSKRKPRCPRWLSKEGRARWKEIVPELSRIGLLSSIDGFAVAAMLTHWDLIVRAGKALEADGLYALDEHGNVRKHPMCQILRDNSQSLRAYLVELGLTPSARSRLSVEFPDEVDDPLVKLLEG